MIELRWVYEKPGLLQYRYRRPEGSTFINAFPPTDWEWSEWIDVKHVVVEKGVDTEPKRDA